MRWLYRLQTRLGLTGPEGAAALVVILALTGGTVARHLQSTSQPLPADFYAAADAAFAAAPDSSATEPVELSATEPLTVLATEATTAAAILEPAPIADSSAASIATAAVEAAAPPRRASKPPPVRTNINTATPEQLQRLPGIGPALASRIDEHRRLHGPFRHPDHIVDVSGIGEKTLERLRPWIHL